MTAPHPSFSPAEQSARALPLQRAVALLPRSAATGGASASPLSSDTQRPSPPRGLLAGGECVSQTPATFSDCTGCRLATAGITLMPGEGRVAAPASFSLASRALSRSTSSRAASPIKIIRRRSFRCVINRTGRTDEPCRNQNKSIGREVS